MVSARSTPADFGHRPAPRHAPENCRNVPPGYAVFPDLRRQQQAASAHPGSAPRPEPAKPELNTVEDAMGSADVVLPPFHLDHLQVVEIIGRLAAAKAVPLLPGDCCALRLALRSAGVGPAVRLTAVGICVDGVHDMHNHPGVSNATVAMLAAETSDFSVSKTLRHSWAKDIARSPRGRQTAGAP